MALATILFYSIVYTLLLKPNTSQNIVIGGAAGAMAPVGAWAAASGSIDPASWILFLIVFLWTPPHFWALAMYCKDDYVKAKLPMPNRTQKQMNCWEFTKCGREAGGAEAQRLGICPVYPDHGTNCAKIAGTFCYGETQGTYAKKIGDCQKCDFYLSEHYSA